MHARDRNLLIVTGLFMIAGVAALWPMLSIALDSPCTWMAPLAALDLWILSRLGRIRRWKNRRWWFVGITLLALAAGGFTTAAIQFSWIMGMSPQQGLGMIGAEAAINWWRLNLGPTGLLTLLLALPLAWWLGR